MFFVVGGFLTQYTEYSLGICFPKFASINFIVGSSWSYKVKGYKHCIFRLCNVNKRRVTKVKDKSSVGNCIYCRLKPSLNHIIWGCEDYWIKLKWKYTLYLTENLPVPVCGGRPFCLFTFNLLPWKLINLLSMLLYWIGCLSHRVHHSRAAPVLPYILYNRPAPWPLADRKYSNTTALFTLFFIPNWMHLGYNA